MVQFIVYNMRQGKSRYTLTYTVLALTIRPPQLEHSQLVTDMPVIFDHCQVIFTEEILKTYVGLNLVAADGQEKNVDMLTKILREEVVIGKVVAIYVHSASEEGKFDFYKSETGLEATYGEGETALFSGKFVITRLRYEADIRFSGTGPVYDEVKDCSYLTVTPAPSTEKDKDTIVFWLAGRGHWNVSAS